MPPPSSATNGAGSTMSQNRWRGPKLKQKPAGWPSAAGPAQERQLLAGIFGSAGGPGGIQVVAHAGALQPVVAPTGRQRGHGFERHIRPLRGEEGYGAGQRDLLCAWVGAFY